MNRIPGIYYIVRSALSDPSRITATEIFDRTGGNVGNMAFVAGIEKIVSGIVGTSPWGALDNLAAQGANIAIIPCANQFGPHCDMGREGISLQKVGMPVVALGLGAQASNFREIVAAPVGTQNWIRSMSELAVSGEPNIGLRGLFTYRQLERLNLHHQTTPLGCPSHFISPKPFLGREIATRANRVWAGQAKKIAVLAGQPKWPALRKIDASLTKLIEPGKGLWVVQDPIEMLLLARKEYDSISTKDMNSMLNHFYPLKSNNSFRSFVESHARLYTSISEWMADYAKCDFVIGPRIHGVVLALQAGIPAVCVAHDTRTQELCEMMSVPWVAPREIERGVTRGDIPHLFRFDPDEFDRKRIGLAKRHIQFLRSNGLTPIAALEEIARANMPSVHTMSFGAVDHFTALNNTITGWAFTPEDGIHCSIEIRNQERIIGTGMANGKRNDLINLNEGFVGFRIQCSESVTDTDLLSGAVSVVAISKNKAERKVALWEEVRARLQQQVDLT